MSFGRLATHVFAREIVIGIVLWSCRSTQAVFDLVAGIVCLLLIVAAARWAGVLGPHRWGKAWQEGILLFVGGTCLANILLVLFGLAPWFERGPA